MMPAAYFLDKAKAEGLTDEPAARRAIDLALAHQSNYKDLLAKALMNASRQANQKPCTSEPPSPPTPC